MAYPRRRRGDRGHLPAAHRRRPDAHRTPLADDVSPAFLARQRHRARDGHQRDRHRPLGHPRQDPRRPLPQALGRAGPRLRPALLPPRRRPDGRLLRDRPRRRPTLRRAGANARSQTASPRSSRWPCPKRCRSKGSRPFKYAEACVKAMRDAVGDDIDIMVDCHARPSPADGPALRQGARALRPLLLRGALLARDDRGHRPDPARRLDARSRPANASSRSTPSASCSRTSSLQRPPTRHHPLRRPHRGPADRRDGRGVPRRARPAQSAGAGQHRRLARVRLRHAFLHHLRNRP